MIKPKFITFTGIDEYTNPLKIRDLSIRYPVEWGILFSAANQGRVSRYPSLSFMRYFLSAVDGAEGLKLSAHICGRYSRDILITGEGIGKQMQGFMGGRFDRTQINIADGETDVDAALVRPERAAEFARAIWANKAIVQCRGEFPDVPAVDWLYDRSGGAGVEPSSWAAAAASSGAFCGYAGGIGPENVLKVLGQIEQVHPAGKEFWIDMEGRVRTEEALDLAKCEAVLEQVYG